ncbi:MAG: RING finger protein, partial [Acutalibacteraceae bacterium]
MSFNINGLSCVRCKTYLFPEDDVVYCPVCGAPHHRECYNALNHCALESLHGTPEEYSREKELEAIESANEIREEEKVQAATTRCEICGEVYDSSLEHCPKCGAEEFTGFNNFIQFDMLGGVPADYDLGDGITANDAKNFVMANTHRYIQKFALLNKKHKV